MLKVDSEMKTKFGLCDLKASNLNGYHCYQNFQKHYLSSMISLLMKTLISKDKIQLLRKSFSAATKNIRRHAEPIFVFLEIMNQSLL